MSALNLTKVWVDGEVVTAADLNTIRTILHAYFNGGASLEAAQIADRYANATWTTGIDPNIGNTTRERETEPVVDIIPTKFTVHCDVFTAGTLVVDCLWDSDGAGTFASILPSTVSVTAANYQERVPNAVTVLAGRILKTQFAGDATPWNGQFVTATLWYKSVLRS